MSNDLKAGLITTLIVFLTLGFVALCIEFPIILVWMIAIFITGAIADGVYGDVKRYLENKGD